MTLASLPSSHIRVGHDLVEAVALDYLAELRRSQEILVSTPEKAIQRRKHVREVLYDALTTLEGASTNRPRVHTAPRLLEAAFASAGLRPEASAQVLETLFDIAFKELSRLDVWPPGAIARALNSHIYADVTQIIYWLQWRSIAAAQEHVDSERVMRLLSPREAGVFDLVVLGASTHEIAAQLGISSDTVKHHLTNIGHKLGGGGRPRILQRARELGLLVAVPAAVGSVVTAITALI
jgi:LuxR family transcriptional regulator of spore coat protein